MCWNVRLDWVHWVIGRSVDLDRFGMLGNCEAVIMYQRKNIFNFSNYRCLPAGGGGRVFFLWHVVSSLCAHSLIPLQLCIPFDPKLIKKCKSKLYLINVILCVKAVVGGGGLKIPGSGFLMCKVWEPDFPQAIFSNQPLWKIFFIVLLFLTFLEFKEIKSNGFIVTPHIFSSILRFLLTCCKFSNMTVALSYRSTLEACFKDVHNGEANSLIHVICWWCPLDLWGACMVTIPSHPFVCVCAAFPRPSVLSPLEQFLSLGKKKECIRNLIWINLKSDPIRV